MMRKFKMLGLAVGATLALSAALASAAQAETGVLTAPQFPAFVTGEQQGGGVGVAFDIGEPPLHTVTCNSRLDATLVGPSDPVTFRPTYGGICLSDPAGTPTTVTLNGCDYVVGFTKPGTTGWGPTTGAMQARLNCPAGQRIEIHVYENGVRHGENVSTCTYDIPPQGPVPAGVHHNTNMGIPDVDLTFNAQFTAVSTIGAGGFLCGGNPITQHLPITLTGNYTVRAFEDINGVEGPLLPLDVG